MHTYTVYLCARHVYSNVQSQCVLNGTGWPSDNRSGMERNERGLFRAPPGLRRDGGALYENTPSKHHCAAFIPRILWFQHIITYRSSTSTILHRHRMFDITFFVVPAFCIFICIFRIMCYIYIIYMFSLSFALLLTPILWLVCQFSVGFFFLSSKGTHVIFIFFFYLFFFLPCRDTFTLVHTYRHAPSAGSSRIFFVFQIFIIPLFIFVTHGILLWPPLVLRVSIRDILSHSIWLSHLQN